MKITIGHLYPELLNLYGDKGNVTALVKRCEWRGIETEVRRIGMGEAPNFSELDIVLLGGGSDRDQFSVLKQLKEHEESLRAYIENDGVVLAVCGGFQLLGSVCVLNGEQVEGLSVLEMQTAPDEQRFTGNVVLETPLGTVVGFENHGGRTDIGSHLPLGTVRYGNGNNGKDETEGVIYRNLFGTYLHGPILPKNPNLTDAILQRALEKKYGSVEMAALDDAAEYAAQQYIVNRFLNGKS